MNVHGFKCKERIILSGFNYFYIFSTDLQKILKTSFIKTNPLPEQLFHTDTQTDEQTDGHNDNSPCSQWFVNFQWNTNFLEGFSKFHRTFLYQLFSVRRRDKERDGFYGWNFTVSVRHYKCAEHLQKTWEISGLLADSGADITLVSVRSPQIHTLFIGWYKRFEFGKTRFQIPRWKSIFSISYRHCLVTNVITPLHLLSWHF